LNLSMLGQKCSESGRVTASIRRLVSFVIVLVVCLGSGLTFSQNPPASAPKTADIVTYLTETISWYRGTIVEQQIGIEPSDLTFLNDNRRISSQIVRLAFDFARLEEQTESKQPKGTQKQDQTSAPSQYQRLIQAAAKADQQVEQSQNELQSLRQKLEATQERKRPALESMIAETQSELAFRQARRDALRNILQFTTGTGTSMGAAGLRAQIEELSRSVPSALSGADATSPEQNTPEQTPGKTSPIGNRQQPSGIWGLAAHLVQLSRKVHTLDQQIQSTDQLMQAAKQLREPLVANLRSLIQTGDQLTNQPSSGTPLFSRNRKSNWMHSRPSSSRPQLGRCRSVNNASC
jgi:hypothetical protein